MFYNLGARVRAGAGRGLWRWGGVGAIETLT